MGDGVGDRDDYLLALSGATDLTGTNLDDANFESANLTGRNFSGASLVGTRFQEAILDGANFNFGSYNRTVFRGASLIGATLVGNFTDVDFSGCNLSEAKIGGAFNQCKFAGANLALAEAHEAWFATYCDFEGAFGDESANFDNARAARSVARQSFFAGYDYADGRLIKRGVGFVKNPRASEMIAALDVALYMLNRFPEPRVALVGIGHNNPPAEFAIAERDSTAAIEILQDAKVELIRSGGLNEKSSERVERVGLKFRDAGWAWIQRQTNVVADEFFKAVGGGFGKAASVALVLHFTGAFAKLADLARNFLP